MSVNAKSTSLTGIIQVIMYNCLVVIRIPYHSTVPIAARIDLTNCKVKAFPDVVCTVVCLKAVVITCRIYHLLAS